MGGDLPRAPASPSERNPRLLKKAMKRRNQGRTLFPSPLSPSLHGPFVSQAVNEACLLGDCGWGL